MPFGVHSLPTLSYDTVVVNVPSTDGPCGNQTPNHVTDNATHRMLQRLRLDHYKRHGEVTCGGLCIDVCSVNEEQLDDVHVASAGGRHEWRDVPLDAPVLHVGVHGQQHLRVRQRDGQELKEQGGRSEWHTALNMEVLFIAIGKIMTNKYRGCCLLGV